MQVKDIMAESPACCTPDTSLQKVAALMVEHDCGCIPVVESEATKRPVGVITDRDICCRAVAQGKNPLELTAADCMTSSVVTVTPEMSVDACCNVMEEHQIRRVVVVDDQGGCCGMVAQADIATKTSGQNSAELLQDVSKPTDTASRATGA